MTDDWLTLASGSDREGADAVVGRDCPVSSIDVGLMPAPLGRDVVRVAEVELERSEVLAQMLDREGAGDGQDDRRAPQ